jgi:hypothetical protein
MKTPRTGRVESGFRRSAGGWRAAAAGRKLAFRPALSQTALALMLLAAASACDLTPRWRPSRLDYDVAIIDGGGRIRVEVTVADGPRPTAWVGFGSSPLASEAVSRAIVNVTARTGGGAALPMRQVGEDAYRVDIGGGEPWVLGYEIEVGSPPAAYYHRASNASPDHLVLVGVDAWARFFDFAAPIDVPPADRPLDDVEAARVRFDLGGAPPGWMVVSAAPERALNEFELDEHPARSAFAIGPYRLFDIGRDLGLRAAVHSDWHLARDRIVGYAQQLARVQARQFGRPPGGPALMIFTPFPAAVTPPDGARTAGMVWDRSLLLYGGMARGARQNSARAGEMIAVFLGHELFHLYVPWGLPITQPLSWLSEGWAEHVGRSSAVAAGILSAGGAEQSLRDAYERYRQMGGARAGSLQNASESGEELRELLYLRGELVFRILSLEWEQSGKPGTFDGVLWSRLQAEYDGEHPLEPEAVSRVLSAMVNPLTVRRIVDGAAAITLPELALGRR